MRAPARREVSAEARTSAPANPLEQFVLLSSWAWCSAGVCVAVGTPALARATPAGAMSSSCSGLLRPWPRPPQPAECNHMQTRCALRLAAAPQRVREHRPHVSPPKQFGLLTSWAGCLRSLRHRSRRACPAPCEARRSTVTCLLRTIALLPRFADRGACFKPASTGS